jgi:hypothetical protein
MLTSRYLSALLPVLLCLGCVVAAARAQTIGSPSSLTASPATTAATSASTTTTALPGGSISLLQLGFAASNLGVTTVSPTTAASPVSGSTTSTLGTASVSTTPALGGASNALANTGVAMPATTSNGSGTSAAPAPPPTGAAVGATAPLWLECPASDVATVDAALTGSGMICAP